MGRAEMMQKTGWILLGVVAVAGTGAAYVALQHRSGVGSSACAPSVTVATPPSDKHDDLLRRRLEGIGSTRDLKPVPLPLGDAK
jgi:hypothetical protein